MDTLTDKRATDDASVLEAQPAPRGGAVRVNAACVPEVERQVCLTFMFTYQPTQERFARHT